MDSNKKIQLSRSTGFSFINICSKYFYEEWVVLKNRPKFQFINTFIIWLLAINRSYLSVSYWKNLYNTIFYNNLRLNLHRRHKSNLMPIYLQISK